MQTIQQILSAPPTSQDATVDPRIAGHDWRFIAYHPELEQVLPAIKSFGTDVIRQNDPRWLSILGPSGVGKTFALRGLFRLLERLNENGYIKVKTRTGWRDLQMAHLIPGEDLTDYQAPRDYGRYDLIYIEDIGSGAFGDRGSGAILKSRIIELLQYRSGRFTMLDANLYRRDIAKDLDPRIASRLKRDGSTLIELSEDVPDFCDAIKFEKNI